ncbi:MAG: hypothetical protein FJY29_11795 [Betaproteobacteria bacterium]|nr:hypothetical protein [Betaproteobacteria bacterium]
MRVRAGMRSSLLILLAISLDGCSAKPSITRDKVQEAWDDYNNPALLDSGSVVVFSDLPAAAVTTKIPWSDIYWPSYLGGIALRWMNGIEPAFPLQRPTEEQVRSMSQEQLALLSPAEKYDIFMGRYDFPTVQTELLRNHSSMPTWYGLCHGWSSATLNYEEPGTVTLRGASGVDVPFSSGDVKALLAYAQGVVFSPMARVLGQRCEADLNTQPHMRNTAACRDTNAGSFHLVLANYVGRAGQSVIADFTRGAEVWNFPIYGFSTRELVRRAPSLGAAPQTVVEVVVETTVDFIVEVETPNVLPIGDSRSIAAEKIAFQYALELDSLGRIVGGSWITEERPDFLWIQERADFRGYYGSIEGIYENSLRGVVSDPLPVATPSPVAAPAPVSTPLPSTSQPIGPVLTQPIPVPSAPPVPTPAPVPTLPPVPGDTPIPPVGVPVPQPDLPLFSALSCPAGTSIVDRGFLFCSDGSKAFAPVTAAMLNDCMMSGAIGCQEPLWSNDLYSALRGTGVCPVGSNWSSEVAGCVENNLVLGPFAPQFMNECLNKGFGNTCLAMKIDLVYFNLVMLRR